MALVNFDFEMKTEPLDETTPARHARAALAMWDIVRDTKSYARSKCCMGCGTRCGTSCGTRGTRPACPTSHPGRLMCRARRSRSGICALRASSEPSTVVRAGSPIDAQVAISCIVRPQPMHQPVASSMAQTSTQGELNGLCPGFVMGGSVKALETVTASAALDPVSPRIRRLQDVRLSVSSAKLTNYRPSRKGQRHLRSRRP
jgi:hypothetical protein